MKKLSSLLYLVGTICFGSLSMMPTGCQTASKAGTVVITGVGAAVQSWGDYVKAGNATQSQIDKVGVAYGHYQDALRVARDAAVAYQNAPSDQSSLKTAEAALAAASGDLVALIENILKKK